MKMKKLSLAIAVVAASSGSALVLADAGCTAVAGGSASCENDANGAPVVGSAPVGIAVSTNVRDAMQELVFGAGSACIGNNSKTCMPSISTPEFNAFLTGSTSSWGQVNTANGTVGGTNGVPAGATGLRVCGFDAAAQTAAQAAINKGGACVVPTISTSEGDSIAAVEACLVATSGKGAKSSIGVLPVTTVANANYAFIKLDGVAPTLDEHIAGNYNLIMNVAGTAAFETANQGFGIAGGATTGLGVPVKAISGIGEGCAPMVSSAVFQD